MVESRRSPGKRKLTFWHVLLVLLAMLAVAFGVFRVAVRAKVQRRIAAVRAAGYPTTWAELDAWYTVPPYADNAADYITGALSFLYVPTGEEAEGVPHFHSQTTLPARAQPLDEQMRAKVASLLEENRKALELLHDAASIPNCRYGIDLSRGNAVQTPHFGPLRDAARLLMLEAVLSAAQDDSESATQAVVSGYGLARSLLREPLLISQLVRNACSNLASQALEHVVNRVELGDAQLARIEEALLASYDPNAMVRALAGERCFMLGSVDDPRAAGMNGPPVALWHLSGALGLLDLGLIRSLDHMSAHMEIAQSVPHHRQQAITTLESQREGGSRLTLFLDSLTPAIGRIITLDLHHLAQLQVTRTAIAVQRYRLAQGRLPQTLDDLTPAFLEAMPTDPFDGQPLRFQALDLGFVVYSIGPDGTDDGGRQRQPRRGGHEEPPYDVPFIVER